MLRLLTGPSHTSARHFYSGLTVEPGKPVILINCVGVKLIKAFVVSRIQTNLRYKCFTSVYITYNITVRNNGTMKIYNDYFEFSGVNHQFCCIILISPYRLALLKTDVV